MEIRQIRNATLQIAYAEKNFLIDPIFAKKGTYPPFPNAKRSNACNPLVDLPVPLEELIHPDAVIVTHLHRDHFDEEAKEALEKDVPLFVQNETEKKKMKEDGFTDVRVLTSMTNFVGISLQKTGGVHGYVNEKFLEHLGTVCGVVFKSEYEKTVYLAGDTIYNKDVEDAIKIHRPDVIIVNAGANNVHGEQLIMGTEDVLFVHQAAPHAKIIATHMEAENHWNLSRVELRAFAEEKGFSEQLIVPEDGEIVYVE
ncbi:MAG: MBL fold metallo-hydrolase [Lachnospiraceae bacterium]|nr:MBL fold metallo-hydrolase [Lachnospiraceae bacterium]MDD3617681.1 MBL fold metallo-hydrolase [Lachnospiraceae bacterium]